MAKSWQPPVATRRVPVGGRNRAHLDPKARSQSDLIARTLNSIAPGSHDLVLSSEDLPEVYSTIL
jgi:hypothetical protein